MIATPSLVAEDADLSGTGSASTIVVPVRDAARKPKRTVEVPTTGVPTRTKLDKRRAS
jgi:hypothetical protein